MLVGESMEAAGSRELLEETGVALSPGNPVEVLGMWESVYPPVLGLGHPVRQHLVVYLLALLPLPADSIQVQLQAKEVDAGVWLNCEQVSLMLHRGEKETMPSTTAQTLPAIVVNKAGESVPGEVNTLRFRQPVANETEGPRITSGTRYALVLWLDRCRKNQHKADQPSFSANL
ncbi:nucleoside diphosphate-linked moiety X motif 17 isoform X2 [Hyalella azteca]|uniref:Nucleoside diphosphate-linked moiety X motif 17 isoform X2 n=1 Tax=Hyalella azteca TaxID=294128 RepID=A0A979FUW4_HYAAZ|nr:nucleoside diphosphate-linked moiety X motif 17 isoform X2 [Hyalella azteca]